VKQKQKGRQKKIISGLPLGVYVAKCTDIQINRYTGGTGIHSTYSPRDREIERQRDKETERQRDREAKRQRDRKYTQYILT
jgi:hypothetical protein